MYGYGSRRRGRSGFRWLSGITVMVLLLIAVIIFQRYEWGTEQNATFTVKSLDDQSSGSSGHKYLVFTTDNRVFENTDSWFHGKTDSSNVQAGLTVGHTYTCPVFGARIFLVSSYKDILDGCTDITDPRHPVKIT